MAEKIKTILNKYPEYEAAIGMEIHVQLKTNSKIFCSCKNQFGDEPNKNICQICAGYPGVLPVLNKKVVDYAIMAGIATNCHISEISKFDRKHYSYPDLPKNYQITQGDLPICTEGYITIELPDGIEKKIKLTRIHIEEDAGKNIHTQTGESYIDLNRAGTPLLEIVSYPDLSNAYETKAYLTHLKTIVQYLGISDADMEKGSFRGDVNISVKKKTDLNLGTKVELKNINSFKFITQAIEYEIERQINAIESGEKIIQETRTWDSKNHISIHMRSKEESMDYRYVREPDLPLIIVNQEWMKKIKKQMPELPHEKLIRFQKEYGLSTYETEILVSEVELANFFEQTAQKSNNPKQTANWMLRNLLAYLKEHKLNLSKSEITPELFAELISAIDKGTINSKVAQDVFLEMAETKKSPSKIIKEKGLQQIESVEELEKIILKIIKDNPETLEKYLAGRDRLFQFFVGQAMKATKGKGNPKIIQELLKKHLKK
jgi:aspartyl-tRNA(Asn)/glutamyl-tRNA(Gln) amidotransferase subunit B